MPRALFVSLRVLAALLSLALSLYGAVAGCLTLLYAATLRPFVVAGQQLGSAITGNPPTHAAWPGFALRLLLFTALAIVMFIATILPRRNLLVATAFALPLFALLHPWTLDLWPVLAAAVVLWYTFFTAALLRPQLLRSTTTRPLRPAAP